MGAGAAQCRPIDQISVIRVVLSPESISRWSTRAVSIIQLRAWAECRVAGLMKCFSVPRKVLKDQFDASVEPDEPQQIDMEQNQDELYDEDQFYRESEAIPPAPKLHRELATSDSTTALEEPSTSANPPLRSRDSSQLEGKRMHRHPTFDFAPTFYLYVFPSLFLFALVCRFECTLL